MGFQTRLNTLEPVETWPTLEQAAWERYWDGLELAAGTGGRDTGSLYLLGYVVEMVLKVAFFRLRAWPVAQAVDLSVIRTHAVWRRTSNLHDVEALAQVLIQERAQRGLPFDPVFAGVLTQHVRVLASHWKETLRYCHSTAREDEVAEVFQSADWVLANRHQL